MLENVLHGKRARRKGIWEKMRRTHPEVWVRRRWANASAASGVWGVGQRSYRKGPDLLWRGAKSTTRRPSACEMNFRQGRGSTRRGPG
jgi:hypothetical protein